MTVIVSGLDGDELEDDAGAHDGQAARGEDVTATGVEVDGSAKRKRKKKSKSNKKALDGDHGAGFEPEVTNNGAFVHIFVL